MTTFDGPVFKQGGNVSPRLTDEQIEMINRDRPKSKQLKRVDMCGGKKPNGETCEAPAGAKTPHLGYGYCASHGGNSPSGKRHAAKLMGKDVMDAQRFIYDRFGGDRNDPSIANITAEQALLEEVRRSVAMVRWLEEKIGEWDPHLIEEDQDFDTTKAMSTKKATRNQNRSVPSVVAAANLPSLVDETTRGVATTTDQAEWLRVYREERTHAARVSKMAIDAGIAHRMVSIAEDQGRVLASSIKAVLGALGLTPDQQALVPQVVPTVLRAVANNQPVPDISSLANGGS